MIWLYIFVAVLILILGLSIGILLMRIFFNRKDTIDKALIWINHSGHYDKFKGDKLNEVDEGIVYIFKYGGKPRIATIPNTYGFNYHKGKRMIWAEPNEILGNTLLNDEQKKEKDEQDEQKEKIYNELKLKLLKENKPVPSDYRTFNDLIKDLVVSKLGKDGILAMSGKAGAINILVFIIAIAVGAVGMYIFTSMNNPKITDTNNITQQSKNINSDNLTGAVTFSEDK